MRILAASGLGICLLAIPVLAQKKTAPTKAPVSIEPPNAERTRGEINYLLTHYPPSVRNVLSIDPGLLSDETWLTQYPALANFLRSHPEVTRNPGYYIGTFNQYRPEPRQPGLELWRETL